MDKPDKLAIYKLGKSVPDTAKKTITEGNLKGFTDINPMWRIKTLTEIFGPCGFGWYTEITEKWIEQGTGGGIAAFMKINLYVKYEGEWSKPIPGIGGSMLVNVFSTRGLKNNDEAFKMAYTDAISVACKSLGIGADVYYAKDRTKYDLPDKDEDTKEPVKYATEKQNEPLENAEQNEPVEYATEEQIQKINNYYKGFPDAYEKALKKYKVKNVVQLKRTEAQSLIDRLDAAFAKAKAKRAASA